ncbi:MAG: glycosyltransferase [Planctomycetota bacterium]
MSEPRRVLYHHRIRADDGQAVHVRELITALRAQGHTVDECALVPKAVSATPAAAADDREPGGGFWQRLSLPRTAVEVAEVVYNHKGRAMLRTAARLARPDFVYERHALHLRAGLDVARELSVPLLLEVNSPMTVEMERLGKLCLPRRARRTERHVLQHADAVLAVTEVLADVLVDLGARRERVHVIGNGAVPDRYDEAAQRRAAALRGSWQLPDDAFVLGFVGYMRPWHRLDLVLDVMCRPGFERLQLALMGEGPALEPLLEQAHGRGVQDRVRAFGVVAPAELPTHVMACDGALIPAINAYASPLKLFDSLCAGVVTLAPDQPNLRENIEHGENGLLFAAGDADDLAAQLRRVVADRELSQRIGAAGRRSLLERRWTWAGNADRVLEVFERLRGEVPA